MNGLAPGMLINFNNGDPGKTERNAMEAKIKSKWSGSSSAGKIVLAFNEHKDEAATIETVDISDLDKQYQFLSEESMKKIMVGHRVTSPLFSGSGMVQVWDPTLTKLKIPGYCSPGRFWIHSGSL